MKTTCYTKQLMKPLVKYLQKHLTGEVLAGEDVVKAFSADASLLERQPLGVIYARNEKDIRKALLFLSQVAIKGRPIPLTVRGGGSDLTGAAVGHGLILVMPAYLNKQLKSSERKAVYRFEAGYETSSLSAFLADRGIFLPPAYNLPVRATIGGAVANNVSSKYSTKYGLMEEYIRSLRVVLANGEDVEICKLSRNQFLKKMTLGTFEGDIYRELNRIFFMEDSPYNCRTSDVFERNGRDARRLSGYNLARVCPEEGGIDLIPLFAGSQGTLGIITEVEIDTRPYNKRPQAVLLRCPNVRTCHQLITEIQALQPSVITMINGACFARLKDLAPFLLSDFTGLDKAEVVLIVEFDEFSLQKVYKKIRKMEWLATDFGVDCEAIRPIEAYANIDRLRSALSLIFSESSNASRHVWGGFRGAYIPLENLANFYAQARLLFRSYQMKFLIFGEVGFNHISVLPKFTLNTPHHQRRFLKFLTSYSEIVSRHGGRLSLERQEGSLLGQFLTQQMEENDYRLLQAIKSLFDPYNILNPTAKLGASTEDTLKHLKTKLSWDRFHQQLPRLN